MFHEVVRPCPRAHAARVPLWALPSVPLRFTFAPTAALQGPRRDLTARNGPSPHRLQSPRLKPGQLEASLPAISVRQPLRAMSTKEDMAGKVRLNSAADILLAPASAFACLASFRRLHMGRRRNFYQR